MSLIQAAAAEQSPNTITLVLSEGRALGDVPPDWGPEWESVSVSVADVKRALSLMGAATPEHDRLARIACAMLEHLDTIRDEAHFSAALAAGHLKSGRAAEAAGSVRNVLGLVNRRGIQHALMLRRCAVTGAYV